MRSEVSLALSGMKSSITTLLRRIEDLENKNDDNKSSLCVATKEALKLPGFINDPFIKLHSKKTLKFFLSISVSNFYWKTEPIDGSDQK